MTYLISKTFTFSASHELLRLPPEHKCHRNHGHNYAVTLILETAELDDCAMVCDYGSLAPFKEMLDATFDHRLLNDVMGDQMPTAEILAVRLYYWAVMRWPQVIACTVKETDGTSATYLHDPGLPTSLRMRALQELSGA